MSGKKSRRSRGAGSTPALVALTAAGISFTPHTYDHDPRTESYGLEAAEALGISPERVLKTLMAEVDGALVVAIVAVSASLDLKALAAALGGRRAQMADPRAAQRATGYVLGGISPLGQRTAHRTAVDASVEQHDTVFVSAGRRGTEVELAPQDLVSMTGAVVASIARP